MWNWYILSVAAWVLVQLLLFSPTFNTGMYAGFFLHRDRSGVHLLTMGIQINNQVYALNAWDLTGVTPGKRSSSGGADPAN